MVRDIDLRTYIKSRKALIDKKLNECLPKAARKPAVIHRAMRYSVFSGGKRIRPIIAMESCLVCGGKTKNALAAGCAVELVHTYSLIHDDLPSMDNDDFRRGKPASHKVFGEATAILAGDALLTLAFNVLAKGLSPETGVRVIRALSEAVGAGGMVGGQVLDLEFKNKKKDKKITDRINLLKTAMLFKASAESGAIAARAGKDKLRAMAGYGLCIGTMFQITDDMIDGEYSAHTRGAADVCERLKHLADKAGNFLVLFGRKAHRLREIIYYVAGRVR